MYAHRFADPETLQQYPFSVAGPADWQGSPGDWRCCVTLPDLPAGWIVAPSLSVLSTADYRFQFALLADKRRYKLAAVPATEPVRDASNAGVKTAIDCFHILRPLTRAAIEVTCASQQPPERYLLVVCARPLELSSEPAQIAAAPAIRTRLPPPHSQMLENPRHAGGICSPVSTAMVLAHHGRVFAWEHFIASCYDPITRAYGVWPLAIRSASRHGCLGAIELLSGWDAVIACLERDIPVVASIRFAAGALPGAPMASTAGHLVVVHGFEGDRVLVNDPAAPHHGSVTRRYPITDLGRAWFRHRGAAYILLP